MSTLAEAGMAERMAARDKREQLKVWLDEVPLLDVLRLVRERASLSSVIENPRERAIITRYLEDAEARLFALEGELWSRPVGG